tara:strand:+ start:1691 stop:2056 length:366 start_codon:yes stop_codon:yes gene_type:complete
MIADLINDYGFPIVAAVGMGYFVYYIWKWVTLVVKPRIGEANSTLIGLIDRVRMLDNDMIRLTQKIEMIIEFKEEYEKLTGKKVDFDVDDIDAFKKDMQKRVKDLKDVGKTDRMDDTKKQK